MQPGKGSLLIVDDEAMNRDMLSRRLERSGFEVGVACGGEEALRIIDERPWDLVLLDQMMPERSGIDVLRELRNRRSPTELPVIMVTAVADSAKIAEALDAGANDYVTKPIDFTVALARIRSHLSRKQAADSRKRHLELYALAARASHDGLWDWDLLAETIDYSPRWKEMLELASGEISDSPVEWFSRVHPEDLPLLERALSEHLEQGSETFECEYRMRANDGRYLWMAGRGTAAFDADGRPVRMAGSQSDITARKTTDELTGLPNRIPFVERAGADLSRLEGANGPTFALLLINLDRLKLLNDSLGHTVGDQLLVGFARRICEVVWNSETPESAQSLADPPMVARLGGDEFVILLEGLKEGEPGPRTPCELAGRILKALRPEFRIENQELFASASIGIAISRRGATVESLLHDADTALHVAKSRGRARAAVFDEPMRDKAANRLQLERDLRVAMSLGQLAIFYQPRVDLDTGSICGFEALLRWKHPVRGLIPPVEFIPIAEETGLIREIGLWVLRESCKQIQVWRERWRHSEGLDVAVNVSPLQLRDAELVNRTREILDETGLEPSALHLEVTESSILENMEEARRILMALKNLGVGLKLDDFATGYSCLAYLSQLPFDSIKIDRSFTVDLGRNDSEKQELIRTILTMAHNLRLGVIAEGIEDENGAEVLKEMGCRFAQGYYFSRPVDAESIERLLTNQFQTEGLPQ